MKTALTLGAIALAACGLAQAQAVSPGSEASGSSFSAFDKNNDGRISLSEARSRAELSNAFQALDKDSDGYLTKQELSGWSGTRGSDMKRGTDPSPADSTSAPPDATPGTGTGGATGGGISTTTPSQ